MFNAQPTGTVISRRSDSLDHDSRVSGVCQRHQAYPCLRDKRDELLSFDGQYVCSAQLAERVHQLGLAPGGCHCHMPAWKRPYHGGRRRAGLSPSSSVTGRHPSPGPSSLSLHRPSTVPDVSQVSVTRTVTMKHVTLI